MPIVEDDIELRKNQVAMDEQKQAAVTWDAETEKKLRWKCDRHVLPCITLLFFMSFLDRTNIGELHSSPHTDPRSLRLTRCTGNARMQGMVEDLNMTGHDYNIALFVFFPPYILFEVPSNITLKRIKPSTWLSIIMMLWGRYLILGRGGYFRVALE